MAEIVLDDVGKIFADGTEAVRALDLEILDGEFMVLVDPVGLRQDDRAASGRRAGGDLRTEDHDRRGVATSVTRRPPQ